MASDEPDTEPLKVPAWDRPGRIAGLEAGEEAPVNFSPLR